MMWDRMGVVGLSTKAARGKSTIEEPPSEQQAIMMGERACLI